MEFRYIRPLVVAAIIDICLGAFLILCGILEFTNILATDANNTIRTVGVQLSQLVFISGILIFASGGLTFLHRKTMRFVNLQIFIGVGALAWPIFVSIALFFSQRIICIRLLPSMLAALFYTVSILVVKITNEALSRTHKINTKIVQTGKRRQGVNVAAVLGNAGSGAKKSSMDITALRGLAEGFKTKNAAAIGSRIFFSGGRRRSGVNPFRMFFSGHRKRSGGGFTKRLYSGGRRRRGFRR